MLTGTRGDLAIKIFGPDVAVLAGLAESIRAAVAGVPGAQDVFAARKRRCAVLPGGDRSIARRPGRARSRRDPGRAALSARRPAGVGTIVEPGRRNRAAAAWRRCTAAAAGSTRPYGTDAARRSQRTARGRRDARTRRGARAHRSRKRHAGHGRAGQCRRSRPRRVRRAGAPGGERGRAATRGAIASPGAGSSRTSSAPRRA